MAGVFEKRLSVSHLVYGLRVLSNLPIPGLAVSEDPGSGSLRIWLKDPVKSASSNLSEPLSEVLYSSPGSNAAGEANLHAGKLKGHKEYGFFYSDGPRFSIDSQGREICGDWPAGYSIEDACTYLVGPVIAFALRLQGSVSLHASSIAVGNRAIALLGPPGAGKSTTAAAFAHLGFPVLSDDVVVLADEGDRFLVQPGYPRVNLWPDSVRALSGSEDALPRITPTWGKRYLPLDGDRCRFQKEPLPLGGIYVLRTRRGAQMGPIEEELQGNESLLTLVANTYVNYLLDEGMRKREFEVLSRLVAQVPIRQVTPSSDPSRVFELCNVIIAADAAQLAARAPGGARSNPV